MLEKKRELLGDQSLRARKQAFRDMAEEGLSPTEACVTSKTIGSALRELERKRRRTEKDLAGVYIRGKKIA